MNNCRSLCLVILVLLTVSASRLPAQSRVVEVASTHRVDRAGSELRYVISLPRDYRETNQRWPLIVFLHGGSGRGDDINLIKQYGPPRHVSEAADFRFVVLSPQIPEGEIWSDSDGVISLLDEVLAHYAIDPKRVYLTGMSMGGRGTWYLAYKYPNRFAAIAPIAAFQTIPEHWARNLRNVPVWAFHGDKDTIAPVSDDQLMIDAIKGQGGNPRLTILSGRGHDIGDVFNKDLYDWFLEHRLP
jgi:predicted peptidase